MGIRHWLQLALTDGIGPILTARIIETAGGAEAACGAKETMLRSVEGIGTAKAAKIAASLRAAAVLVPGEIDRAAAIGVSLLSPDDQTYPTLLRSIPDPPPVLYVKGAIEPRDLHAVAIVGSRKCSYYGREQAERFAALMAGAGITVISGGARGVDSSAHRGAMSHPHGRTIAVLGSGIDVPYPPENAVLFEQIASERGAVVSEYPLGTAPLKENFPRRNRIVSGMSRGVLVVEADERSGALITARQAGDDHGRTVFALPGRVDNPLSAGPHQLIRDGAVLVTKLDDIVEALGPLPHDAVEAPSPAHIESADRDAASAAPQAAGASAPSLFPPLAAPRTSGANSPTPPVTPLSERQRKIVEQLDGHPVSTDTIIERTGLSASEVFQELTLLTLKGVVRRVEGQTFVRKGRVGGNG